MTDFDPKRARILAALVNTGKYQSFKDAEKKLISSRLAIKIADEAAYTPAGQAALLTAVVTAARCFGLVSVPGIPDYPLALPISLAAKTLAEAAQELGALPLQDERSARTILIGPGAQADKEWSVRALWNGWCTGIMPGRDEYPGGRGDNALAGIAAGALAVAHAFAAEQGNPLAGRKSQLMSLWSQEFGEGAFNIPGPEKYYMPDALWLIGLGNLGQAFLWSLAWLPYKHPENLRIFLQDDEVIDPENWGTSILVRQGKYGELKTKIAENWVEARGFQARRIDRRLDEYLRRTEFEPGIALAGLDKMPPRRLLGLPGFEYVIDVGLGATAEDYQKFRFNVFDKTRDPAQHFAGVEDNMEAVKKKLMQLPAYQSDQQDDDCGKAILAGKSVAVPFVSAFAGAMAVTEAVRIASGQAHRISATGTVCDLENFLSTTGTKPLHNVIGYTE